MAQIPATRYVTVGDDDVAYQVFGEGEHDFLYFIGMGSHIDLMWDSPQGREFTLGLASISRVARFDRRGTGASGGARERPPSWEEWTEDIEAVLDAADFGSAVVFAEVDSGPVAIPFAAMHPERVSALVLANTTARCLVDDEYPIGLSAQAVDGIASGIGSRRGHAPSC